MTVPTLAGRHVVLRAPTNADADTRLAQGIDAEIHRMFGGSRSDLTPLTPERTAAWLTALMQHPYGWIIEVSGAAIGEVRLDRVDGHDRRATLALGIFSLGNLGRGYGTEAVRLIVDHAFNVMGLHRLGLRVLALNERALRTYQKCGFVIEGREREAALVDGEWHDDIIMGLLAPGANPARGETPHLTPELGVIDIARSLAFYRDVLGFAVVHDRPDEGFAYLRYEGCELMLDQIGLGRTWATGSLEPPLGRGMNFQCMISSLDQLLARLSAAGTALYLPLETKTYLVGDATVMQRQFCVQDPDGYLLRFCEAA